MLPAAGEQAQVGAAERQGRAEGLPLPHHHVDAEVAGRLEQPERDGVGGHDHVGADGPGRGHRPGHVLQAPEVVGLLQHEHARRLAAVAPAAGVAGQAVRPSSRSTIRSWWPEPAAKVAITSRQWGWTPRDTHTPWRPVAATDRFTASTQAEAPS